MKKSFATWLAQNMDLNKLGFPIINHRNGVFWVLDGQHRIDALKQCGFKDDVLDCEVYEDLSDEEMADIFLGRDERRAINAFDKFHVACTANHRRECDIRRAVESQGAKISRRREENCISAVSALGHVYDRTSETVVGQVVRTIKNAYAGDPASFDSALIEGLGFVFNRYNGRTNEKELATRMSAVPSGARGILRRAESLREKTGNQKIQCVAATIVDIYNRGAGKGSTRLASWWKEPPCE